jgi:hypothetical protein
MSSSESWTSAGIAKSDGCGNCTAHRILGEWSRNRDVLGRKQKNYGH